MRSACSLKMAKFVPLPSKVAPSGYALPGQVSTGYLLCLAADRILLGSIQGSIVAQARTPAHIPKGDPEVTVGTPK